MQQNILLHNIAKEIWFYVAWFSVASKLNRFELWVIFLTIPKILSWLFVKQAKIRFASRNQFFFFLFSKLGWNIKKCNIHICDTYSFSFLFTEKNYPSKTIKIAKLQYKLLAIGFGNYYANNSMKDINYMCQKLCKGNI